MWKLVCLASMLLATTACLNLNKSYPGKRSFVLDVSSESREPAPEATVVLKISKFRVSPLFVGRAMVYRIGELQYENDFYDEWFVSPGALLTQQFHDWLSRTGRFRFVLLGTNHIEPTHILQGSVAEFYGDYRVADLPKAIFGIELLLLDGLHEGQAIFRRTYHRGSPSRRSISRCARRRTHPSGASRAHRLGARTGDCGGKIPRNFLFPVTIAQPAQAALVRPCLSFLPALIDRIGPVATPCSKY